MTHPDNHETEEEFQIEFFGNFGRDIGAPKQYWCNTIPEFLSFIKQNNDNKAPSFMSVQPRKKYHTLFAIEKLFWDFDYADKTFVEQELLRLLRKHKGPTVAAIEEFDKIMDGRKAELQQEVGDFIQLLLNQKLQPLVIKTCKGFHVYVYFDKVYEIPYESKIIGEILKSCIFSFDQLFYSQYKRSMKYADIEVINDIYRVARVPYSIHEKSGQKCFIVKFKRDATGKWEYEEDKIRGLAYYNMGLCLDFDFLRKVIKLTTLRLAQKQKAREDREAELKKRGETQKVRWELDHGFVGKIRPCFEQTLKAGEMRHQMRLACLMEAYFSGIKTEEGLIDVFKPLHDFTYEKTQYQVQKFFEYENFDEYKPYSCETLQRLGFCIKDKCEIYKKRNMK